MYRMETEHFLLEMGPDGGVTEPTPAGECSLRVKVEGGGFSGESVMEIDCARLGEFAMGLRELCEAESGSVIVDEEYTSNSYVRFIARPGDRVTVNGIINNGGAYGFTQLLAFENAFGRDSVRALAEKLVSDYGKYSE